MFQNIANVFVVSYLMNPDKEDPGNLFFLYAIIDNIKYRYSNTLKPVSNTI